MTAAGTSASVDVLVLGGGIQGLVLLDTLVALGYGTALVTNAALGQGQSLHAHGLLESGYTKPKPDLRASVVEDWLPYLEREEVDVYGNWFVVGPDEAVQEISSGWDHGGYPWRMGSPDDLPEAYRDGDLFAGEGDTRVVAIDDYSFPKRQLIRALVRGHEHRVVIGDVSTFTVARADQAIQAVEVRVHATGEHVQLRPRYLVAAVGSGTPSLIHSIAEAIDFAGGEGAKVRRALEPVTFNKLHMLTLRGRSGDLPDVSAFVISKKLKIVSHLNDAHDGVGGRDDLVTWYVTNEPLSAIDHDGATATAEAAVDPEHTADGFNKLFSMVPTVRERAKDHRIQFFVYAGCKQGINGAVNVQHCEAIDGVANAALALPSLAGGAWLTAKIAASLVQEAIEPTVTSGQVPGAGHATVGNVTEHGSGVKWLDWDDLVAAYPEIDY